MVHNGSNYVNRFLVLDDLNDVDTVSDAPDSGDALLFNGVNFVPRPIVKADISDFTGVEFVLVTNVAGDLGSPLGSPRLGVDQDIYGVKTFKEGIVVEQALTVTGNDTSIQTTELYVTDPYVDINYGETGPGVGGGTGTSGIRVDRGPVGPIGSPEVSYPAAIMQWDESAKQWEFGVEGNAAPVLTANHDHIAADITNFTSAVTSELNNNNDLDEMRDVTYLAAPSTGEHLVFNSVSGDWENSDFAADVTTELNANNLDEMQDVSYTGSPALSAGQMLLYGGSPLGWRNHTPVKADISDFVESDYIHTFGNETKNGSLTINGDFTIGEFIANGSPQVETTVTIDSITVRIKDHAPLLNYGETGNGVDDGSGTSGLHIDRGTAPSGNARILWDENDKIWKASREVLVGSPLVSTLVTTALSYDGHQHTVSDLTDLSVTALEINSLTGIHTGARAHLGATPTVSTQILDCITRGADDAMDAGFNLSFSGGGEVLGLPTIPTVADAAASKQYVDDQVARKIAREGEIGSPLHSSVMDSGINLLFSGGGQVYGLPATPTGGDATAATSKQYVDDQDAAVQANLNAHANDMGSPQVWHMTADQNIFLDAVATGSPATAAAEVNTLAGVDTSTTVQAQLDDKISRSGEAGSPLDRSVMDSGISLEFQGGAEPIGLPATPVGSTSATSAAYVDAQDAAITAALNTHINETGSPVIHHMTPEQNTFMDGLSISGSPPGLQADDVNQLIGIDNSQTVQEQLDLKANFINHAGSPLGSPFVSTFVSTLINGDIQDSGYYVNDTAITTSNLWTADKIDTTKADKVIFGSPVGTGNFAGLDANGNLTDSGFNDASYADWDHTHDLLGSPETILNFGTAVDNYLNNTAVLVDLSDVTFAGLADNDFLRYDLGTTDWINVDAASITEFVHTTGAETIGGDKTFTGITTFSDDVTINADMTVTGTTTFIDSTNLEVTDQHITVNKGYVGATAGSTGSGIHVTRNEGTGSPQVPDTLGSLAWDDSLLNFKAGLLGSETEIARVGLTVAQPLYERQTGNGGSPTTGLVYTLTGWDIPIPATGYAAIQVFVNGIKQTEDDYSGSPLTSVGNKAYYVSGYGTGTITVTFNAGSEPAAGTDVEFYGFGYIG